MSEGEETKSSKGAAPRPTDADHGEPTVPAPDHQEVAADGTLAAQSKQWLKKLDVLRRRFQAPWRSGESLLELAQTVRRELEDALEPLGGGRRVFPFAAARVCLIPSSGEQESLFRAALAEGWEEELRTTSEHHLRECGARVDRLDLTVEVAPHDAEMPARDAPRQAVRVSFEKFSEASPGGVASPGEPGDPEGAAGAAPPSQEAGKPSDAAPAEPSTLLRLVVEEGSATQPSYSMRGGRIALGRMVEVFDQHGRIRRRNDIAFEDEGEINSTVSREHARILYRAVSDDYWIVDDRSSYGTRIFRDGQAIDVSSRDRRGIRLRAGDRVYLGRAVLACELEPT